MSKKSDIIYTKEFVSKEVNWLMKDIEEMKGREL